MSDIYKILRIDEMEYGCEGIPEGQEPKVEVTIETKDGSQFIMQIEDSLLYKLELNEGDSFTTDKEGNLAKI